MAQLRARWWGASPPGTVARRLCRPLVALVLAGACGWAAPARGTNELLTAWFNAQTNVLTWTAEFTQVRTLKALTQPLVARGRVWFAAPSRFRWELGEPARTIAVRQARHVLVIYPLLNRAERFALDNQSAHPWTGVLASMEGVFAQRRAEWESRFRLLSLAQVQHGYELTFQPTAPAVRRFLPQMRILCAPNDFSLTATELWFADGSTLRNDFTNAQVNPRGELDNSLFEPALPKNTEIVEPFRPRGVQ